MESFESQQNKLTTHSWTASDRSYFEFLLRFFVCFSTWSSYFLLVIEDNDETAVEIVQAPVHQPVQSWVHGVLQVRIKLL